MKMNEEILSAQNPKHTQSKIIQILSLFCLFFVCFVQKQKFETYCVVNVHTHLHTKHTPTYIHT